MRKLLFLFVCLSLTVGQIFAQSHTVKGKVTDDKGAGIPNASILVKGTTIGTTSESDGTFSLNVPAHNASPRPRPSFDVYRESYWLVNMYLLITMLKRLISRRLAR